MKLKKALRAVGIIVPALALVVGGSFTYLYFNGLSGMSRTSEAREGQIKVACIGDSITYGHGIANWPKNNYPAVLQELLGEEYHVNSYGVSGYAVQTGSDRPYRELPHYQESLAYDADVVVFMMGTNDSKPQNWVDGATFRADLESLLDSYENTRMILCTPAAAFFVDDSTGSTTNFDIQPGVVEEIAGIVREVAQERQLELLDVYELTREHGQWFARDGVHPSNAGAAAIAEAVCGAIGK